MEQNTKQNSGRSIGDIINNLDRRIVFLTMLIMIMLVLLKPLGIPITIGQNVRNFNNEMEKIGPDDLVVVDFNIGWSMYPEIDSGSIIFMQHLFDRHPKIILWERMADAPPIVEHIFSKVDTKDAIYGEDWVDLGYVYGIGEDAMLGSFLDSFGSLFTTDTHGTPLDQLPLMQQVHGAEDVSLYVLFTYIEPEVVVRRVNTAYGIRLISITCAGRKSSYLPFTGSGQISGAIIGIRESAEYELIRGKPGPAISTTDALSIAFLVIIFYIVLGNVSEIITRVRGGV